MNKKTQHGTSLAAAIRPFDQSLPHVLLRARETTMRFFRPLLAENNLTEQQWRVLRALHRGGHHGSDANPPDVGELADRTFLLGPSLTRILANLEERGWLARSIDPQDQRRSLIRLTPAGEQLVDMLAPDSEAQYRQIEARYGRRKLEELFALLEDLAALEHPAPGPEGSS